jgi:hypothetical protein
MQGWEALSEPQIDGQTSFLPPPLFKTRFSLSARHGRAKLVKIYNLHHAHVYCCVLPLRNGVHFVNAFLRFAGNLDAGF